MNKNPLTGNTAYFSRSFHDITQYFSYKLNDLEIFAEVKVSIIIWGSNTDQEVRVGSGAVVVGEATNCHHSSEVQVLAFHHHVLNKI